MLIVKMQNQITVIFASIATIIIFLISDKLNSRKNIIDYEKVKWVNVENRF
jgi:hypothetical protein